MGEGTKLPSIFRLKRIGKKRKGSERSKNSDRDSGPEAENTTPPVVPAPRDSRDKGSTGGKRRPKKSAIETPKVCATIILNEFNLYSHTRCLVFKSIFAGPET